MPNLDTGNLADDRVGDRIDQRHAVTRRVRLDDDDLPGRRGVERHRGNDGGNRNQCPRCERAAIRLSRDHVSQASNCVEADLPVRQRISGLSGPPRRGGPSGPPATSDDEERILFDLADFNGRFADRGDVEAPQPARRRTKQLRAVVDLEGAVMARTDINGIAYLPYRGRYFLRHAAWLADELDVTAFVRTLQADGPELIGRVVGLRRTHDHTVHPNGLIRLGGAWQRHPFGRKRKGPARARQVIERHDDGTR